MLERTLVLIKPDGVRRSLTGQILARLERCGLRIVALKMLHADRETALKHYLKALKLNAKNADVHQKVGMSYYNLGKKPKACKSLRSYLKLKPGAPGAYRSFVNGYCGS